MKHLLQKILAATMIACCGNFVAHAEYNEDKSSVWSKSMDNALGDARTIYVEFDLSKLIYADMPYKDLANFQNKKEEADMTIRKFETALIRQVNKEADGFELEEVSEETGDDAFIAKIYILDLTEKGGVKLRMHIYPKGKPDTIKVFELKAKEGKWNSMEKLLLEKVNKLGEELESDIFWAKLHSRKRK